MSPISLGLDELAVFGLDEYLDFEAGGYGSDNEVHANLVGIAQESASAKYGPRFGNSGRAGRSAVEVSR